MRFSPRKFAEHWMYPYEGMILLNPVAHAADPEGVEKSVRALLEKHGAKVHEFARWDERKLAYEIKGHKRGVYLLSHFEIEGGNIDALSKECNITESILRQIFVRLDRDIPAYLERQAKYYDKMREEAETRRQERDREPRRGRDDVGEDIEMPLDLDLETAE